jgi:hypothetical protein
MQLPEERTLMRLQREYEVEFGMELGGDRDGSGKSVKADLVKCLLADCEYALSLGKLKVAPDDSNALVQENGKPLCCQFKMDACNTWKNAQQTSLAYLFPRACTNPGSPYDTTEFALFEGDDHWDAVSVHAVGSLKEMNALVKNPFLLLARAAGR